MESEIDPMVIKLLIKKWTPKAEYTDSELKLITAMVEGIVSLTTKQKE